MLTIETEHKSAGQFAWYAQRDARMRSVVNSSLFNDNQKLKAERVKLGLEMTVFAEQIHIEYRKKFISVKVHKPRHIDKKTLAKFESDWTNEGYTKVLTSQGFTIRVV
jgi:hypothetical protein